MNVNILIIIDIIIVIIVLLTSTDLFLTSVLIRIKKVIHDFFFVSMLKTYHLPLLQEP